jgi:hypothetical protein
MLQLVFVLLFSQAAADPLLARLDGRWTGTGTVLNAAAVVTLHWEWTLDRQFLRLTFNNQMGSRRFEGHAYYRALGNGRYRGTWFDNAGMIRPIEARADGDALVAAWGTPETEEGETTYRLRPDGTLEIVDRVKGRDGAWRPFGQVVATRAQSGLMNR